MGKLENKVALITGDMWGIPLATAELFVEEGGHVFLLGLDPQNLNDAVKTVGKNVTGLRGQASNLAALDRLYNTVKKERGWVDIVFLNPASANHVPLEDTTKDKLEFNFHHRLLCPSMTVKMLLP